MSIKDKLLGLIGIEPITNRDLLLEELAEMPGNDLFIHTGLVFNEAVISEMQSCNLSYDEWLDQPATRDTIFKERVNGTL